MTRGGVSAPRGDLTREQFAEAACEAAQAVFSMMVSMDLEPGEPYQDLNPPPFDGVVALLAFDGDWVGSGMVCCQERFACQVSSGMLGHPRDAVDSEVLDGIGEVANMVLGNVKEILESRTGSLSLSVPTVLWGKNFCARSGIRAPWWVQPFHNGEERFEVRVCLKRR